MKQFIKYSIVIILALVASACEEVIEIDLTEAEPRLVVEGNISSSPGPYQVLLSTSGGYFNDEAVKAVSGAQVFIEDEEGYREELFEKSPGIYRTDWMIGREGLDYTLDVVYDGITYSGSENLPKRVEILELEIEESIFADFGPGNDEEITGELYDVHCIFEDPADEQNYYRFFLYINGELRLSEFRPYEVSDDELFNGLTYTYTFYRLEANPGDEIKVELQTTGFNTYEYFRTLNDALSDRPGATPYNPITNMDNNALGYFGAYTVFTETITAIDIE